VDSGGRLPEVGIPTRLPYNEITVPPATYTLETFGCQMNVLDSELVEGQLRALGLRRAESHTNADVILFNTCSVREHAEHKVLSRLGHLKKLKRQRPEVVIGVIGCMAERQKEGLFVSVPHLDLLCGPGELHRLPGLLQEVWDRHERVAALAGSLSRRTHVLKRALEYDSVEELDMSRQFATGSSTLQEYVRVQRGCDKFCTYCIVPFVRGAERSRPPENILAEVRSLARQGCREVTLLGQTVNSYVYEENGHVCRLAQLLERVHAVEGIDRIRFVTSFPADWDEDIFRVMRDFPRVCPYLHIPAQSGSDRILKAMKRGYTATEYLRLMDTARKYVPDIALAGDFIVGFCGETEEDFRATVELVRRVEYKSIFVFKYSPRPGTAADRGQADDVPAEVKAWRNNELLAVQSEISLRQKQAFVGRTVEVLVEGFGKRDSTNGEGNVLSEPLAQAKGQVAADYRARQLTGRTPHDLIAVFDGDPRHIGAVVSVRVESASALTLFGRIAGVVSPSRRVVVPRGTSLPILGEG
jgi:tRNA-2-methylthio-N6-dimethylallyladenosine synthase